MPSSQVAAKGLHKGAGAVRADFIAAERIGPGQASGLLGEAVVPQLGDDQHPALRARYACGKGRTGRVAVNTGQAGGVLL